MSTPASRRLRLSLTAVGVAFAAYAVDVAALRSLVRRAEATREVYPYKNEDWLRWLLPALWAPTQRPLLLITGPSTARENIRIEMIEAAFPEYRPFQGGLSLGAMSDVLLGLQYVELEYGEASLPSIIILGVSPRFLADIPSVRPMPWAMANYAARHAPDPASPEVPRLTTKSSVVGTIDRMRFLIGKQQARYQAAVASLFIDGATLQGAPHEMSPVARRLEQSGVARLLSLERPLEIGTRNFAREIVSPYRYFSNVAWPDSMLTTWLDEKDSWWREVYAWDPAADSSARLRIRKLLYFAALHHIEVFVVNLPEREISRQRYQPAHARAYDELLHTEFASTPLLDLRCALPENEFMDAEHALLDGAHVVTQRVIGFVGEVRAEHARYTNGNSGKARSSASIAARWSSPC